MTKPLFKTTIVVWSNESTAGRDIDSIARDAMDGDCFCSSQECEYVADPSKDEDYIDTSFFNDSDDNDEEDDGACDECGAIIPPYIHIGPEAKSGSYMNKHHNDSCSLYDSENE